MKKPPSEKKYFALFLLVLLGLFFFYAAIPLLLGISGAAILYVMIGPFFSKLNKLIKNKPACATITLIISFLVVVIPVLFIIYVVAMSLFAFFNDPANTGQLLLTLSTAEGNFNITDLLKQNIGAVSGTITQISLLTLNAIADLSVNLLVMYIVLFYLLVESEKSSKLILSIIPFSEKGSRRLAVEFSNVIKATFIGNGAVAVIVGVLMAAGLYVAGAHDIVFWAAASIVAAIIPIIGLQIVWIPAGLYFALSGNIAAGLALMAWGAFLSYVLDGYVRQMVQRKIASIHPFVSIIGLLIGITYFGITGIIIGPLLISLFVLSARIFKEEYVPDWNAN